MSGVTELWAGMTIWNVSTSGLMEERSFLVNFRIG